MDAAFVSVLRVGFAVLRRSRTVGNQATRILELERGAARYIRAAQVRCGAADDEELRSIRGQHDRGQGAAASTADVRAVGRAAHRHAGPGSSISEYGAGGDRGSLGPGIRSFEEGRT